MSPKLRAMLRALGPGRAEYFEAVDCLRSATHDGGDSVIEVLSRFAGGDGPVADAIWQAASEMTRGTITSGTRSYLQRTGALRRDYSTPFVVRR